MVTATSITVISTDIVGRNEEGYEENFMVGCSLVVFILRLADCFLYITLELIQ